MSLECCHHQKTDRLCLAGLFHCLGGVGLRLHPVWNLTARDCRRLWLECCQATAINTYATIGVFLVSLVVGFLIDRYGRKKTLIMLVIGGAISSGLSGAAIGAASMVIIRAFSGFAVSEEVVNAVYLNEIYKKAKGRGFMYSLVQSGWPVGALLAAGMTSLLLPVVGWRGSFFVAACAPSLSS